MSRVSRVSSLVVCLLAPHPVQALVNWTPLPLQPIRVDVGRLFPATGEAVRIVVHDTRGNPWLLASSVGRCGPYKCVQGYGLDDPAGLGKLFEAGAQEAVEALGTRLGEGGATLEITIADFRIELAPPQFGLQNFISLGDVRTRLLAADESEMSSARFLVAGWDTASKLEILAHIYLRAAWEATVRTLLDQFPRQPEDAAVQRLIAKVDAAREDEYRRSPVVFWLGLVARDRPAVAEKLLAVFRQDEDPLNFETAALALARAGVPGAREEIEAVLTGTKKLPYWTPREDAEQAFTLLHALGLLRVEDLASRVPTSVKRHRDKLPYVVKLHESGEIPRPTAEEVEKLGEKWRKGAQKR